MGESHDTIGQFGAKKAKNELKNIKGVIAVSTYLKKWIVNENVVEGSKVEIFPNGIDGKRFKNIIKKKLRIILAYLKMKY